MLTFFLEIVNMFVIIFVDEITYFCKT